MYAHSIFSEVPPPRPTRLSPGKIGLCFAFYAEAIAYFAGADLTTQLATTIVAGVVSGLLGYVNDDKAGYEAEMKKYEAWFKKPLPVQAESNTQQIKFK